MVSARKYVMHYPSTSIQNQKIQMRCERLAKNLVKTEAALKDAQRLTDAKVIITGKVHTCMVHVCLCRNF